MKITIPSALKDITLLQYKKYLNIQKQSKDEKILEAKMIEIFCNIKIEEVMLLKLNDSQEIINIILKTFDEKPPLIRSFKIDQLEYGFHPQLDNLTFGEYIDLDTYITDWENIEKAMNVLYRPVIAKVKSKYSIDKYNTETSLNLLNMPMDAVMSSIFFLWNLGLELSTVMTNSLENQDHKALTQYLNSTPNTDGINHFMHSLTQTLQNLKISLN
jgi:hypothetical protein|tara:strand:+ start:138 stop:782 length:645 start_codon:yes stop_codon:yes gene_type:complete